jgi:hypothetical protein
VIAAAFERHGGPWSSATETIVAADARIVVAVRRPSPSCSMRLPVSTTAHRRVQHVLSCPVGPARAQRPRGQWAAPARDARRSPGEQRHPRVVRDCEAARLARRRNRSRTLSFFEPATSRRAHPRRASGGGLRRDLRLRAAGGRARRLPGPRRGLQPASGRAHGLAPDSPNR